MRAGSGVLHWQRDEGAWIAERAELPAGAQSISFDAVPEDLREEIIAIAVRTKAVGMGGQDGFN